MRSKSSMYNLIAAMLLQIITLIIGIVLPRVMLLSFGSEINGLVSSIKQFISYITLVEAGLAGACIYSLYKPLADNNYVEINKILSGTKRFYNKSSLLDCKIRIILISMIPAMITILIKKRLLFPLNNYFKNIHKNNFVTLSNNQVSSYFNPLTNIKFKLYIVENSI